MNGERRARRVGILGGVLVALLCFAIDARAGAPTCYQAHKGSSNVSGINSGPFSAPTFQEVHALYVAWRTSVGFGYTYTAGACTPAGRPVSLSSTATCPFTRSDGVTFSNTVEATTGGTCPTECEHAGKKQWAVTSSPYESSKCADTPACRVTATQQSCSGVLVNGYDSCTALLSFKTDSSCGSSNEPPNTKEGEPEAAPGEKCQAIGDGEYCASSAGDGQCGYFNDSYVCLQNVAENECVPLGDGGRVCGGAATTTPPVPDNGTPGELATPDGQVGHGAAGTSGVHTGMSTFNYYNSVTVVGSSRDPGEDGGAPSGGSPSGGGSGSGDGDGSGCTGETCGEGVPVLDDIGTMTEAFTDFWDNLQGVPLVEAATGIAPAFPAGACPNWSDTIDIYGEAVDADFTFICSTWTDVSPVLSVVALVFWGVVALRILLSA